MLYEIICVLMDIDLPYELISTGMQVIPTFDIVVAYATTRGILGKKSKNYNHKNQIVCHPWHGIKLILS